MQIVIHRGTHQIGGCATEICAGNSRIIIDMGSQLPNADGDIPEETLSIPGVTEGEPRCDAIFFTHTHGDHIGQLEHIHEDIPIYIGKTGKELLCILNKRLNSIPTLNREGILRRLDCAKTFRMAEKITIGAITVTPFWIDHSDFDAYMFLIEAEGQKILHTGDFRLHGFRGNKTPLMLQKYVGEIDWLICEGTMLSRDTETAMTERELQEEARELMRRNKRVFVLCSSMNIDRIAGLIHAIPDKRPVVCDPYQKDVLRYIEEHHGKWTELYCFEKLWYHKSHIFFSNIAENGCLAFIRVNDWSRQLLDQFEDGLILYSMWKGYRFGKTADPKLVKFLEGRNVTSLHTSGHATADELRQIVQILNPRKGILPIHTEVPERFRELFPEYTVKQLSDGEILQI